MKAKSKDYSTIAMPLPFVIALMFILASTYANAQGFMEVSFPSTDNFELTADLYHSDKSAPTILLFHQSVSSRGEYRTIAPKLREMGFNCLAVDLRWGKQDFWNKVPNESARRNGTYEVVDNYEQTTEYQLSKVWPIIWKAYEDMKAAIGHMRREGYHQKMVAMGSSFSALLVFKLVSDGLAVDGLAAFSPGEYHPENDSLLALLASEVRVPVYLSAGSGEREIVEEVRGFFPSDTKVTLHHSEGRHGASVLIDQKRDWEPLQEFLEQFLSEKKAVGFKLFQSSRSSVSWDGSGKKPINGWYWYPIIDSDVSIKMSRMEYVRKINPDKPEAANFDTFKRLANSLAGDTLSNKSIASYLQGKSTAVPDAPSVQRGPPLIVLSGAHPIYFVSLAEKLALAGYSVVSMPRTGIKKGERLPFSKEGVMEYREDMNYLLDNLDKEGVADLSRITFVSWSFEGVPTLQLALERGAKGFVSLDSSLGYAYGASLVSDSSLQELPFTLIHYTGLSTDFGKHLDLLKNKADISIIKKFDLAHGNFTSLASIAIPKIVGKPSDAYKELIEHLIIQLNQNN